jgi:radical SAM protein with 4Fe4S-binding SPASM domain
MCRCARVVGDKLSFDTFSDIAATLFPYATFVDLRGWGESTILPDFERYLDLTLQFDVRVKLITNGTVNRPGLWRRLGREGVTTGISFDAADAGTFAQIRGGAKLARVIETIRQLVAACREAGHDPAEKIYFCITASRWNLDQLDRIIEIGLSLGLKRFKIDPLSAPDGDPGLLESVSDRVLEMVQRLNALGGKTGCLIEYSSSLLPELTDERAVHKVCIHPWDYCYINSRGRIGFCDHLNGREEFTWGEWGAEPFLSFWNGPRMTELRAQHLRRLRGEQITACADCNWCYDRRYMDLEDWVVPEWERYRVTASTVLEPSR